MQCLQGQEYNGCSGRNATVGCLRKVANVAGSMLSALVRCAVPHGHDSLGSVPLGHARTLGPPLGAGAAAGVRGGIGGVRVPAGGVPASGARAIPGRGCRPAGRLARWAAAAGARRRPAPPGRVRAAGAALPPGMRPAFGAAVLGVALAAGVRPPAADRRAAPVRLRLRHAAGVVAARHVRARLGAVSHHLRNQPVPVVRARAVSAPVPHDRRRPGRQGADPLGA